MSQLSARQLYKTAYRNARCIQANLQPTPHPKAKPQWISTVGMSLEAGMRIVHINRIAEQHLFESGVEVDYVCFHG